MTRPGVAFISGQPSREIGRSAGDDFRILDCVLWTRIDVMVHIRINEATVYLEIMGRDLGKTYRSQGGIEEPSRK